MHALQTSIMLVDSGRQRIFVQGQFEVDCLSRHGAHLAFAHSRQFLQLILQLLTTEAVQFTNVLPGDQERFSGSRTIAGSQFNHPSLPGVFR